MSWTTYWVNGSMIVASATWLMATGAVGIAVTWEPTIDDADYINIVSFGADPDEFGPYKRVGSSDEVTLSVPGEEGLYEIRVLDVANTKVLARKTITVQ